MQRSTSSCFGPHCTSPHQLSQLSDLSLPGPFISFADLCWAVFWATIQKDIALGAYSPASRQHLQATPDGVLSVLPLPLVSDFQRSAHTPVMEAVELFQVSPSSTQHSLPYCSTERVQALYMCLLVATVRCSSLKTAYLNAPKALDAFATLLFTSMCD